MISLIDFWRLQRQQAGERCVVRPCHRIKAKALTDLVLGRQEKPNLMILEPPRIGKTDLGVKAFVPWAFSYVPDSEFILSSYASDLAVSNAIHVRATLSSDWYRSLISSDFGATVAMRGEQAGGHQDFFHTLEGGCVKAVGFGGGITGFGAGKLRDTFGGAIMIDDPLKAQDGRSAAARQFAINYIHQTLKSRRNRNSSPTTPMVLVMQRLHPQDPAGQLLLQERDQWKVVQIPAIDENGDSIWPARISKEELDLLKEVDPETYWAQYMQEPSQTSRAIFKTEYWKYWKDRDAIESRLTYKIITADTAFKAKDSADFSVFSLWGFMAGKGIFLLDSVRGQWDFPDLMANAKAFLAKSQLTGRTPVTDFFIEDKASGTSLVQTMKKEGLNAREWLPNDKTAMDKVGRAKQCTLPLAAGRVFLPSPALPGYKWVERFVNEHTAFTDDDSHLNDDQVDTTTMAVMIWQQRGGGIGPLPVLPIGALA